MFSHFTDHADFLETAFLSTDYFSSSKEACFRKVSHHKSILTFELRQFMFILMWYSMQIYANYYT